MLATCKFCSTKLTPQGKRFLYCSNCHIGFYNDKDNTIEYCKFCDSELNKKGYCINCKITFDLLVPPKKTRKKIVRLTGIEKYRRNNVARPK